MSKHINGCYENVYSQADLDYAVKAGMPEDLAKPCLGKKMKYMFKQVSDKSVWSTFDMEGSPEWSMACLLTDGVESSIEMPGIGTVKICTKFTGPDSMEFNEDFPGMGIVHNKMTFCEKGVEVVSKTVEKDCQHTYYYQRVFDLDGTWRVCGKVEGDADMTTPMGDSFNLKEFLENPTYKYCLKVCDEGFMSKDTWDDQCIVTKAKWGEEVENPLCKGMFDLHIKTGPGSFKTVSKKDGNMQETTVTCCGVDKMKIVMKDLKTGKSLNCMTEKFCDFSGKYKIVSTSGMADFCKALGVKEVTEVAQMFSDPSTEYCLKETGCFLEMSTSYKGKTVHKLGASYGEELSTCYPYLGEKPFQVVATKQGNCVTMVSKGPCFTLKTVMKKTKNFLIACDEIVGTGIKQTQICVAC